MARSARFLLVLVVGLAALTGVGYALLTGMMRSWSEDDLALRSRLAVAAANDSFDGQSRTECQVVFRPGPHHPREQRVSHPGEGRQPDHEHEEESRRARHRCDFYHNAR